MGFFTKSKKKTSVVSKANNQTGPTPAPQPAEPPPVEPPQSQVPQGIQQQPQQQHQQTARPVQPYGNSPTSLGCYGPGGPQPAPPPYAHTDGPYQPIVVNQHYYLNSPPSQFHMYQNPYSNALISYNAGTPGFDSSLARWDPHNTQLLNQGAALFDRIAARFDDVMTSIDRGRYAGNEGDLFTYQPSPPSSPSTTVARLGDSKPANKPTSHKKTKRVTPKAGASKGQTTAVASTLVAGGYFAKVELYANSRLPKDLPPLKLYMPTYPLLCLAAQYSERVYENPVGSERDSHINADWRSGTKAMCIKSVPMDHMDTIVFAIRGTATFMDWAVNLNVAPTSPDGFLDDPGNLCHTGFLSVACNMIKPVAARLRQLLQENPKRASSSLLITGHSAGGAVASLLYSHMLSDSRCVSSELNELTGCFKRIHCVTFGAPPISLLPLAKPDRPELKKSLFMSFINEGDPVARADKAYVRSLLELFAAPTPDLHSSEKGSSSLKPRSQKKNDKFKRKREKPSSTDSHRPSKSPVKSSSSSKSSASASQTKKPMWQLPPSTLSNAGRIVVLRSGDPKARPKGKKTVEERLNEGVIAQIASDEQLRGQVWGDPVCHVMKLYASRIEALAVGAVTVRNGSPVSGRR